MRFRRTRRSRRWEQSLRLELFEVPPSSWNHSQRLDDHISRIPSLAVDPTESFASAYILEGAEWQRGEIL